VRAELALVDPDSIPTAPLAADGAAGEAIRKLEDDLRAGPASSSR
jgi:hypothetical protein